MIFYGLFTVLQQKMIAEKDLFKKSSTVDAFKAESASCNSTY